MPELPEVERGRRIAQAVAAGRRIEQVRCADDRLVFDEATPARVRRVLKGRRVLEACRHGKQLWLALDAGPHPLFHFGMTGSFVTPGSDRLALAGASTGDPDDSWPPRFWKMLMRFDDGAELCMLNKRRLGRIRLRDDPRAEPPIADLGFDPLTGLPDLRSFRQRLARRSGTLKGLLLDQSFAAGVGNWVADEVLYQARLDPRRSVGSLSDAEVARLRTQLGRVVTVAVQANADSARFPRGWLFHRRWDKSAEVELSGHPVQFTTVAGRTTAFVPDRQG